MNSSFDVTGLESVRAHNPPELRHSQSRSHRFVESLRHHGFTCPISRVRACVDTAAMESIFSLLQKNVLDCQCRLARQDLRLAIATCIERTYHRRRQQRRLGKLAPIEYETINRTALTAAV